MLKKLKHTTRPLNQGKERKTLMVRQTETPQAIYSSPDIPFDNYLCNTIACQLVV